MALRTANREAGMPLSFALGLVIALAPAPSFAHVAQSRVIYLNHGGVTLAPGTNDSRLDTSTLVNDLVTLPAWQADAQTWQDTVACVAALYLPFDVKVIDYDPADVPHMEAVFGGAPAALNLEPNTLGISPFAADCSSIEKSIVVVFTEVLPADPRAACYVAAQELAHSYGLDHEMLASDPMSYSYQSYDGDRAFQDKTAACGEYSARPCGVNGASCRPDQNSFALLTERLGKNPHPNDPNNPAYSQVSGGCAASHPDASVPCALIAVMGLVGRRSRRQRRRRPAAA